MKLTDMLSELEVGKAIRRDSWGYEKSAYVTLERWQDTFVFYLHRKHPNVLIQMYPVSYNCLMVDDWEFVERN